MDLNKSLEFFNPANVKDRIHIIGCGSIGGNVAELLARYGVTNMVLWDFDEVEPHNIANQIYFQEHIGMKKRLALDTILTAINPNINLRLKDKYEGQPLEGFVFMCVDSVEVRNQIVDANWYNPEVKAIFDFRTTLLEGQCYFAEWTNQKQKTSLKESLNFTHEEAQANTPVSACGFELSVSPVVKMCSIMGIVNFTNYINKQPTKHLIICDPYSYSFTAM